MTGVGTDLATLRDQSERMCLALIDLGDEQVHDAHAVICDISRRVEAELSRLREQVDSPTSDEIAESAMWLDAVSEAFPDFDFSGCYDFDDLRKHMIGQATRLREQRDAALRIPPAVRQVIEKALRRDMTQPPVTRKELQFALDLLPEPPSFRSSVDGMSALQAAEARCADLERELDEAILSRNSHALEVARLGAQIASMGAEKARCARLQQALREIDRHLTSTGGSLSPRHANHWRAREAAREALAGPEQA